MARTSTRIEKRLHTEGHFNGTLAEFKSGLKPWEGFCVLCRKYIRRDKDWHEHLTFGHRIDDPFKVELFVKKGGIIEKGTKITESGPMKPYLRSGEKKHFKGEIILAKLEGYPWWPGMICSVVCGDKENRTAFIGKKAHVVFFENHTNNSSWLPGEAIRSFDEAWYGDYLRSRSDRQTETFRHGMRSAVKCAVRLSSWRVECRICLVDVKGWETDGVLAKPSSSAVEGNACTSSESQDEGQNKLALKDNS